jgi:hypothetical protein
VTNRPAAKPCATTLSGEIDLRKDHGEFRARFVERRAKPRIRQPFPTTVSGTDAEGRFFELESELANLSSSGLYLRLPRRVEIGDQLKFRISFSNGIDTGAVASVLGRVLRSDQGLDGLNGFGLAIMHYEFI